MASHICFLLAFSLSVAKPISLFQLSFEEVLQETPRIDFKGVTPANTFPLVLQPLNFAPAVVAPPSYLFPNPVRRFNRFGGESNIRGAVPLFKPLRNFPFIKVVPVTTSFYLSEPNVRHPFGLPEVEPFPGKVSAPKPAYAAIRDTQVMKKPETITDQILSSDKEDSSEVPFVEVIQFPTQVGGNTFEMRDADSFDFAHSAPGGIVQSTQPSFMRLPFRNSKVSPYLLNPPTEDLVRSHGNFGPVVVDV